MKIFQTFLNDKLPSTLVKFGSVLSGPGKFMREIKALEQEALGQEVGLPSFLFLLPVPLGTATIPFGSPVPVLSQFL